VGRKRVRREREIAEGNKSLYKDTVASCGKIKAAPPGGAKTQPERMPGSYRWGAEKKTTFGATLKGRRESNFNRRRTGLLPENAISGHQKKKPVKRKKKESPIINSLGGGTKTEVVKVQKRGARTQAQRIPTRPGKKRVMMEKGKEILEVIKGKKGVKKKAEV